MEHQGAANDESGMDFDWHLKSFLSSLSFGQVRSFSFVTPFLCLNDQQVDATQFTLGYLLRRGLDADWLPTVQISLWQRFIELLKSSKNDIEVALMLAPFMSHVSLGSFDPEIKFEQVGYDKKIYVDICLLTVCVSAGAEDAPAVDATRDRLCQAAMAAHHWITCQLSVAMAHSPTYKALWIKTVNFAKQALDSKDVLVEFRKAQSCLQSLSSAEMPLSTKLDALRDWCRDNPKGLHGLSKSLQVFALVTEHKQLCDLCTQVTASLTALSFQPCIDYFSSQWTADPSESGFAASEGYIIQQSSSDDIVDFELAGF